jgi:hypothetical protein
MEAQREKKQQNLQQNAIDEEEKEDEKENFGLELNVKEKPKMVTKMAKLRKMVNSAMQEEQPENGTKQPGKTSVKAVKKVRRGIEEKIKQNNYNFLFIFNPGKYIFLWVLLKMLSMNLISILSNLCQLLISPMTLFAIEG